MITDIFFDNKIRCRKCYKIFCQTEYYKQCVINKISDSYNNEYDSDLEREFKYFIEQINKQCYHKNFYSCIIS